MNQATIAVLAGAAGAVVLLSLMRRTRRLVVGIVLAVALALAWTWLRR